MPLDDIYWNSIDFGSEEEESISDYPTTKKNYVDPWDLENYAYIREQLDSAESEPSSSDEFTAEANSTSFCYVPVKREQNYAAIDEIKEYSKEKRKDYNDNTYYKDSYKTEYEENPYETSLKEISSPYTYAQDRWRKVSTNGKIARDRSMSFSYGDYSTNQDLYCKLDEIAPRRDLTLPIYDDVRYSTRRKPQHFGLSNYGHLKIDYSISWNNLNNYIYK